MVGRLPDGRPIKYIDKVMSQINKALVNVDGQLLSMVIHRWCTIKDTIKKKFGKKMYNIFEDTWAF